MQPNIFLRSDRVKRTRVYSSRKAQIRLQSACACLLTGLNLPPPAADKLHSPICNANLGWAGRGVGGWGVSGRQTFNLSRQQESSTVRMSDYPAVCLTCPACWMPGCVEIQVAILKLWGFFLLINDHLSMLWHTTQKPVKWMSRLNSLLNELIEGQTNISLRLNKHSAMSLRYSSENRGQG